MFRQDGTIIPRRPPLIPPEALPAIPPVHPLAHIPRSRRPPQTKEEQRAKQQAATARKKRLLEDRLKINKQDRGGAALALGLLEGFGLFWARQAAPLGDAAPVLGSGRRLVGTCVVLIQDQKRSDLEVADDHV